MSGLGLVVFIALRLLSVLFIFVLPAQQVDITLHDGDYLNALTVQQCTNIPPGICCRRLIYEPIREFQNFEYVEFHNLKGLDIGSAWQTQARGNDRTTWMSGCAGLIQAAKAGPGDWHYRAEGLYDLTGANYISRSLLPSTMTSGVSEEDEGIRAFLGGGGELFASGVSSTSFQRVEAGESSSPNPAGDVDTTATELRQLLSTMQATDRWVWPDLIWIGEKIYKQQGGGQSLTYATDDSEQLVLENHSKCCTSDARPKSS